MFRQYISDCMKALSIRKEVIFNNHSYFFLVVSSPPFEVSETGWGEFFITIKIVFKAKEIKPVSFIHALKLHFDNTNIEIQGITDVVISEFYDEIIISNFPENQQNTFSLNDEIESSAKVLCEGMENALSKVENYLS